MVFEACERAEERYREAKEELLNQRDRMALDHMNQWRRPYVKGDLAKGSVSRLNTYLPALVRELFKREI